MLILYAGARKGCRPAGAAGSRLAMNGRDPRNLLRFGSAPEGHKITLQSCKQGEKGELLHA